MFRRWFAFKHSVFQIHFLAQYINSLHECNHSSPVQQAMQLSLLIAVHLLAFSSSCYGGQHKIVGGKTEQDASNPEYMKMAWKAVKTIAEQADAATKVFLIPVEVRKAETQVVAGIKYILEVVYGESKCEKEKIAPDEVTQANCQLKENPMKALYKVVVWSKPWQNFEQYTVTKIRDL
ncbi:unnamed protein product [Cylicocyclus nassatus]|uniref:Cystatin domain-containing protein n=1 Tax=Cylicocyclus nassatus TaxID=53992 RepID=A0AA36MA78_CYLNA|nr:unnamed protein product [Cylicocyclus nassatus]